MRRIAISTGEPAGIGPDVALASCLGSAGDAGDQPGTSHELVLFGDREVLAARADALGLDAALEAFDPTSPPRPGVRLHHLPARAAVRTGELDPANAGYVIELLRESAQACLTQRFDALVTAPVHKGVINQAGIGFTGHTEFLAELAGTRQVVMMLVGGGLRVALATTHLPLREVADAITDEGLDAVLRVLVTDLRDRFGIEQPRVAVLGLNPHAGEGGYLGREEIEVIGPVVERLAAEGMALLGPLPADTAFTPRVLQDCDAVLAMYHDQGLPVLKHAGFGTAVNVTLGLPFVRTSVDHGTALEMAGSGRADPGSMREAIRLAQRMLVR